MSRSASADEAAAIAAAIGRFVSETGSASAEAPEGVGPWQRAALVEGVGAKGTVQDLEGGARWQS